MAKKRFSFPAASYSGLTRLLVTGLRLRVIESPRDLAGACRWLYLNGLESQRDSLPQRLLYAWQTVRAGER